MLYRFLSPALKEITQAAEYYDARVSGLGGDFVDEVDVAIDLVLQYPAAWGSISAEFRRCNLRRFPYAIVYTIIEAEILIVSVFHQNREPESWRKNL